MRQCRDRTALMRRTRVERGIRNTFSFCLAHSVADYIHSKGNCKGRIRVTLGHGRVAAPPGSKTSLRR
jgi:hypothetical protein